MKKQRFTIGRGVMVLIIMVVLMAVIAVVSINSGKMSLSVSEVFQVHRNGGFRLHHAEPSAQ